MNTTCCVVGGGPAGMMLGYLLAREGVAVTVLEKHRDFFRDFRGDTVHPSTLELMDELELLGDLLKLPHQKLTAVRGAFGDFSFEAANFTRAPGPAKFVALMPQWDFLNFLAEKAKKYPLFDLRMEYAATSLIRGDRRIEGVVAQTPSGTVEIGADLVVGCDGRQSTTRAAAGLPLKNFGVPIDVLWFRISRRLDDPNELFGNINYGRVLVLINRGDYFQAGLIIPKGAFDSIRNEGLEKFQSVVLKIAPYLGERVKELRDWDQVKLLTVQINRLEKWYRPGLLCIGDAAHAMSPAGGVGINLAIQDAVATANLLADALGDRRAVDPLLARVQCRREFPTKVTQFLQLNAHKVFVGIFRNDGPVSAPLALRVATRVPGLKHVMGRVIGVGVRPEHIVRRPRKPILITIGALAGFAAGCIASRLRRRAALHA